MPPNLTDQAGRFAALEHLTWARYEAGQTPYALGTSQIPPPPPELLDPAGPMPLVLTPELRTSLLEHLASRYAVSPDEVTLTAGVSEGIAVACATLVEPGDWALVEKPSYQSLALVPAAFGAYVRRMERPLSGSWEPAAAAAAVRETAAAALRAGSRLALVIVSDLHNPSGAPLADDILDALSEACETNGARLLLDEVYRDADAARAVGTARARHPHCIAISSLTKAYGLGGLRAGWLLAPAEDAARFRRAKNYFSVIPAAPSVHLAVRALERADAILEWGRSMTKRNRAHFESNMVESPGGFQYSTGTSHGMTAFPHRSAGTDATREVEAWRRDFGVEVVPGRFFEARQGFRLGFGMPPERFVPAFERWRQIVREPESS